MVYKYKGSRMMKYLTGGTAMILSLSLYLILPVLYKVLDFFLYFNDFTGNDMSNQVLYKAIMMFILTLIVIWMYICLWGFFLEEHVTECIISYYKKKGKNLPFSKRGQARRGKDFIYFT